MGNIGSPPNRLSLHFNCLKINNCVSVAFQNILYSSTERNQHIILRVAKIWMLIRLSVLHAISNLRNLINTNNMNRSSDNIMFHACKTLCSSSPGKSLPLATSISLGKLYEKFVKLVGRSVTLSLYLIQLDGCPGAQSLTSPLAGSSPY